MEGEESDWEDLPDWVRDFLDKNELTEFVWNYLKSRIPYDTFKDWTIEELRAIKFRSSILNRSKVSQSPPTEPEVLPFLYSPDEEDEVLLADSTNGFMSERSRSERSELEAIIRSSYEQFIGVPPLPIGFTNGWSDEVVHAQLEQMKTEKEGKRGSKRTYSEPPQKRNEELRRKFRDSLPPSGRESPKGSAYDRREKRVFAFGKDKAHIELIVWKTNNAYAGFLLVDGADVLTYDGKKFEEYFQTSDLEDSEFGRVPILSSRQISEALDVTCMLKHFKRACKNVPKDIMDFVLSKIKEYEIANRSRLQSLPSKRQSNLGLKQRFKSKKSSMPPKSDQAQKDKSNNETLPWDSWSTDDFLNREG